MTKRLPRTLKKRLEASLTSLTPREAGRLFLLYYHEAQAKNVLPGSDYPPMRELDEAWRMRLEAAKKRGESEYAAETARYNAFWYLTRLVATANMFADGDLWRISFLGMQAFQRVETLLHQDAISEIARTTVNNLVSLLPRPVGRETYDRMVTWATTDALDVLDDVADRIVDEWEEAQGFTYHEVPTDFWANSKDRLDDLLKSLPREAEWPQGLKSRRELVAELRELAESETDSYLDELRVVNSEAVRALYVLVGSDRLLQKVFGGDHESAWQWVKHGGHTNRADRAAIEAKRTETAKMLADLLAAGKLVGGPAFDGLGLWSPVLIRDGKLPGWAALRYVWEDYLADREVYKYDLPTFEDDKAPDGTWALYDADGDLTGDRLTALVADFVADCRARPWGQTLAETIDLPALAAWLTAVDSPMTEIDAPDLGLVDWETFRSCEGDEGSWWEPRPAATAASLAAALNIGFWRLVELEENYYPTRDDHARRQVLQRIIARLNSLRVGHRAFTYLERPKRGELSLQELLGIEFYTPLERAIRHLGEAQRELAIFKKVYDTLSDKYFGGLPVLAESYRKRLDSVAGLLSSAGDDLEDWLDRLDRWPWKVDTSRLRENLREAFEDKADIDQAVAKWVENIEKFALVGYEDLEVDLGEDEAQSVNLPVEAKRKKRGRS